AQRLCVRLSATEFDSTAPSPGIDSFMQLYPVVLCPIVDPMLQLYSLVDVVRYHLDANPPAVQRIDGHVTMTLAGIAACDMDNLLLEPRPACKRECSIICSPVTRVICRVLATPDGPCKLFLQSVRL